MSTKRKESPKVIRKCGQCGKEGHTKKTCTVLGSADSRDKSKEYHLEVFVNDFVYKGDADNLFDALTDFVNNPSFPQAIKTKVFIKYSKGDAERHKLLPVPRARAMFMRMAFDSSRVQLFAEKLEHELNF